MISKSILLVTCAAVSFSLFSMHEEMQEIKLQGDDSEMSIQANVPKTRKHIVETTPLLQNTPMRYDRPVSVASKTAPRHGKKCWPYTICSEPYKKWSLSDRCEVATIPVYGLGCELIGREVAALIISCCVDASCAQVHKYVWCSRDEWFPCMCGSARDRCISIGINGLATVPTLGYAITALCIFAPWINKNNLNCCERVPDSDELHTEPIELEEKK